MNLPLFTAPNVCKTWALSGANSQTTNFDNDTASRATTMDPINSKANTPKISKNEHNLNAVTDKKSTRALPIIDEDSSRERSDGFDNEDGSVSPVKPKTKLLIDPVSDWDNGKKLTLDQCKAIMALRSNYEKARMMNKLRNERIMLELELKNEVARTLAVAKGNGADSKPKPKAQSTSSSVMVTPKRPTRR